MRVFSRRIVTAFLCLCLCFGLCVCLPAAARADNEIAKVLTTAVPTPVVLMDVGNIPAATSTQGCYIGAYAWYDSSGNVLSGPFGEGTYKIMIRVDTAEGYFFSDNVQVYLNNSAAFFELSPDRRSLTLYRDYVPDVWAPTIIKHPGNETVDEGGRASFVVSATYASGYHWIISSPDGETTYDCSDLPTYFPDMSVTPDGTEKIIMHNVPAGLDGWQVRCVFLGPGGSVNSNYAKLTVRHEEKPEEEPAELPAETTAPEEVNVPSPAPSSPPAETPAPEETPAHVHSFSHSWSSDESYHWKTCDCGEISDKAEHSFIWETFSAPTKTAPGTDRGVCTVCRKTAVREIPYEPGDVSSLGLMAYALYGIGILIAAIIILMIIVAIRDSVRRKRRRKRRRR